MASDYHVGAGGSCNLCMGTHFGNGLLCPYRCETCGYKTGACDAQPCPRNQRWQDEMLQTQQRPTMQIKDWVHDLAVEIDTHGQRRGPNPRSVETLKARILKHCPFEAGIAYAPINLEETDRETRLAEQALEISNTLADAHVGPCTLPEGVRTLAERAARVEGDNHHNALTCPHCIPSDELRRSLALHTNLEIIVALNTREFLSDIRAFLVGMKIEHRHCDDSWYCCRACRCDDHQLAPGEHLGRGHDNIRGPLDGDGKCTCGAEGKNTAIDTMVKRIDERIEALHG